MEYNIYKLIIKYNKHNYIIIITKFNNTNLPIYYLFIKNYINISASKPILHIHTSLKTITNTNEY